MTKAAVCVTCMDIFSPYRDWDSDRRWRWCQCGEAGVRWRDGGRGLLEVTALYGPTKVRVLGLNNQFLVAAVAAGAAATADQWRDLHQACADQVATHYLFHAAQRNCWAVLIRPNATGDVTFVAYPQARDQDTAAQPPATGG